MNLTQHSSILRSVIFFDRATRDKKPENFDDIRLVKDYLNQHLSVMQRISKNPKTVYPPELFNPVNRAVQNFYKINSEEGYRNKENNLKLYAEDISAGLQLILEQFDKFEKNPKIADNKSLIDFCLAISNVEMKSHLPRYLLALVA